MIGKKYIYNYELANYMMEKNVRCLGTGKHKGTGKIFYIFNYDECQNTYAEWNNREH